MLESRHLHQRHGRIVSLQVLRTLAGQGELAEAQAATNNAQAKLAEQEREITEKEGEIAVLRRAETLDFAEWRIALAVLGDMSARGEKAAAEFCACQEQETERRAQWRQDHILREQASALLRKVARRLAAKRDDAAMLEAASLRFLSQGETA